MKIKSIREFFPWFKNNPGLIYMDSAATTLKPQCVIDRINYYYTNQSTNPHNVDSIFCYSLYQEIENVRTNIANFINANSDEIIFNKLTQSLTTFFLFKYLSFTLWNTNKLFTVL